MGEHAGCNQYKRPFALVYAGRAVRLHARGADIAIPDDRKDSASIAVEFVVGRRLHARSPEALASGINDAAQRQRDAKFSVPAVVSHNANQGETATHSILPQATSEFSSLC